MIEFEVPRFLVDLVKLTYIIEGRIELSGPRVRGSGNAVNFPDIFKTNESPGKKFSRHETTVSTLRNQGPPKHEVPLFSNAAPLTIHTVLSASYLYVSYYCY